MSPFKVLGVIPARCGSRRVPGKNVRLLDGQPLIAFTITAAAESALLTRTIVSTDSADVARVAVKHGGDVPFLRPADLSTDEAPDRPYLLHALDWFERQVDASPDAVALLRPTTPFKSGRLIDDAILLLQESGADSVRSVTLVEGVHHPFWMFDVDDTGRLLALDPENSIEKFPRSQKLPPLYRLNGVVDVVRTATLRDTRQSTYGSDMRMIEVPSGLAHDIDTEEDFALCDALAKARRVMSPRTR